MVVPSLGNNHVHVFIIRVLLRRGIRLSGRVWIYGCERVSRWSSRDTCGPAVLGVLYSLLLPKFGGCLCPLNAQSDPGGACRVEGRVAKGKRVGRSTLGSKAFILLAHAVQFEVVLPFREQASAW